MTDVLDTSLSAQLAQLQAQIGDLTRSMIAAKSAGNDAALDQFRAQYRVLSAQLAALRTQANQADMPSDFMRRLDAFSDSVIDQGKKLGAAVDNTLTGASLLVKWLPWIVVGALVILGVALYKGNLKVKV